MAFGDVYGYRTNSRFVAAVAESDEREVTIQENPNPDFDPDLDEDPTDNPRFLDPDTINVVDLVLLGFDSGRRNNVPVADATDFADVPVNSCVAAAAGIGEGTYPGETTGSVPGGGSGKIA